MRYVFVGNTYSPGFTTPEGWFKRTVGYAGIMEYLSKLNTVISINQIDFTGEQSHNGVDHRFVDLGKRKTFFPWPLNRYVKALKPDIVVFQGLHDPLQLTQLSLVLPKTTKIIAHHHAEKPFTGIKKYAQRLADHFVDAYLFASKDMGMEWVTAGNLGHPEKIHEVMEVSSVFYPISKASALEKTGAKGDPVFLWVGRLNDNKDPLCVVSAFLKFAARQPNASLYMIYHTDELLGRINELLNRSEYKDAITLVGKLPNEDLLYWYNSADLIISGSHYEGSGTAVCEAMSCGCIPIVTDIFSFRMITDEGNCGFLYQPGSGEELLQILLQTAALDRAEKRNKCLEHFNKKLSFEAIAKRISEIAEGL